MKKYIKDYITKPSQAVRAMVDGLKKQNLREDFEVDMSTFGHEERGVCFGCAATCTVQEITKVNFGAEDISRRVLATGIKDLFEFEESIDTLRQGVPQPLIRYLLNRKGKPADEQTVLKLSYTQERLPQLYTSTWQENLHHYEAYAEWLEQQGY